jgi:hypothetical protein|tara:strand:+ start:68 stop:373 length:306 start_codon:yes stop_codon:yes gene_type:complete
MDDKLKDINASLLEWLSCNLPNFKVDRNNNDRIHFSFTVQGIEDKLRFKLYCRHLKIKAAKVTVEGKSMCTKYKKAIFWESYFNTKLEELKQQHLVQGQDK